MRLATLHHPAAGDPLSACTGCGDGGTPPLEAHAPRAATHTAVECGDACSTLRLHLFAGAQSAGEDGDGVGREPAVALEGGLQPALGLELPQTREVQPGCGEAVLREYLSICLS